MSSNKRERGISRAVRRALLRGEAPPPCSKEVLEYAKKRTFEVLQRGFLDNNPDAALFEIRAHCKAFGIHPRADGAEGGNAQG